MQQLEKNDKLSWLSKISFGMGAFGKDLVYALVGNRRPRFCRHTVYDSPYLGRLQ